MEIKDLLFMLSSLDFIGSVTEAADKVYDILSGYTHTEKTSDNNVIGYLNSDSDYTVMLDAHIDQVGFIVTDVDSNGFLTVSNVGGIDIRSLPSRTVTVHGKKKISAVFCAVPPHLSSGENEYTNISEIKLDTALGKDAEKFVSKGDFVTFASLPFSLNGDTVCGRSFDDRAGVVCLLETARRLKNRKLPVNVVFSISAGEELGLRGVRTAAFTVAPQESVAVDVTFGNAPSINSEDCCPVGGGGMIGISPVLDKSVSRKLLEIARENQIPHGVEIMGDRTGTNADMIGISRSGVKTATLSIPIRNMHTEVEILKLSDIFAVCDLLESYILSGGVSNG